MSPVFSGQHCCSFSSNGRDSPCRSSSPSRQEYSTGSTGRDSPGLIYPNRVSIGFNSPGLDSIDFISPSLDSIGRNSIGHNSIGRPFHAPGRKRFRWVDMNTLDEIVSKKGGRKVSRSNPSQTCIELLLTKQLRFSN